MTQESTKSFNLISSYWVEWPSDKTKFNKDHEYIVHTGIKFLLSREDTSHVPMQSIINKRFGIEGVRIGLKKGKD